MVSIAPKSSDQADSPEPRAWHVLHTRSRQEKFLAGVLQARGIHHYLPLRERIRYCRGRKVAAELPLFPCYLFLWGTREEAYWADRTKRISRVLHAPDPAQLAAEIEAVRLAQSCGAQLVPHPLLKRGLRVRVTAGPFEGLCGVVEGAGRKDRLVLQVNTLGQAASLEVDGDLLEAVDGE